MTRLKNMDLRSAVLGVASAFLLLGISPATARTYYVSQSSGSDRWSGEAGTPGQNTGP